MKEARTRLWAAFADGSRFMLGDSERMVTMRSEDAGSLALPSGRIVLSDPFWYPSQRPFTVSVPPGRYPIHLALADDEVALTMVLFNEGRPTLWKRAKPSFLSVDSGTACLMDFKVARYLRRRARDGHYERFVERVEGALAQTGQHGVLRIGSRLDATVVIFHTWGGDGVFPAFFGYDDRHKLVCLVVDMFIEPLDAEPISI